MAKKDVPAIVSGAGWIASFTDQLIRGFQKAGKTPEWIHHLVTDEGAPEMKKIVAAVIAAFGFPINREKPFDPVTFIGRGWSLDEPEDARALKLAAVDFAGVTFATCLQEDERRITGEEKLRRLKECKVIRLDAKVGQALYEEEGHQTLEWLRKEKGITYLDFLGTILRGPYGYRFVLCLVWREGRWHWDCSWLDRDWLESYPSAALAI